MLKHVPLTDQQQEAVRALDWLLSTDQRRTGRSLTIAVALVRQATQNPNQEVHFGDLPFEINNRNGRGMTRRVVEALIASEHTLSPHVIYHQESFRLNISVGLQDWWPPERFISQWWGENAPPPLREVTSPITGTPGEPNANGDILDLSPDIDLMSRRLSDLWADMSPPEPPAHAENRAELSRQVRALRSRTTQPQPTRPNRYDLLVRDEAVE